MLEPDRGDTPPRTLAGVPTARGLQEQRRQSKVLLGQNQNSCTGVVSFRGVGLSANRAPA
eukprot:3187550-Pyramimonas_sp.AAC.1